MKTEVITLLLVAFVLTACASKEPYVFRNQDRPTYQNTVNVDELTTLSSDPNVRVLDVRLLEDYQAHPTLIPGATYMNPENIETWASALPNRLDSRGLLYCGPLGQPEGCDLLGSERHRNLFTTRRHRGLAGSAVTMEVHASSRLRFEMGG